MNQSQQRVARLAATKTVVLIVFNKVVSQLQSTCNENGFYFERVGRLILLV